MSRGAKENNRVMLSENVVTRSLRLNLALDNLSQTQSLLWISVLVGFISKGKCIYLQY